MKRFTIPLAAVLIGMSVTGCSTSFLMQLNACNCFTLRRGATTEQFEGPDSRTHSWLGPSRKPQPQSTQKFQVGGDAWEVWVYELDSAYDPGGSWASASSESGVNGFGGTTMWTSHQEYVAFRNGSLEAWGRGTLPRALKGKT
ncbi:MAG TPA: hypothetical protein VLC46_19385 [Thermoanaerobaculia bacterium]|jgi:hypothetical protein|nr:hypothetical protein [Thermoanaerobaculia bacterium]